MYLDMSGRKEPTLNLTKTEAIELVQKIVQQLPENLKICLQMLEHSHVTLLGTTTIQRWINWLLVLIKE